MPIVIGQIPRTGLVGRRVRRIHHSEETKDLLSGDLVESWGHICVWDENCVGEDVAKRWRQEGDETCDEALRTLFPNSSSSTGVDLLSALEDHKHRNPNVDDPAVSFLDSLSEPPPEEFRISEYEYRIATEFFLDHAIQIVQSLLYYSLAGGFASARIVKTLHAVSYLVPHGQTKGQASTQDADHSRDDDRTFIRLIETFQFILDIMNCVPSNAGAARDKTNRSDGSTAHILPGGEGWKAAVRVRMLHGVARRRAQGRFEKNGSEPMDFIPINQEDMSATFVVLSYVCRLTQSHDLFLLDWLLQASAYLALWRHIGFYLGVSPAILRRYFCSPSTADKFLASTAVHLFSVSPSETALTPPTLPILRATSNRPPLRTTFAYNCALASFLLGPELSSHLGIPPTDLVSHVKLQLVLIGQRIPVYFARYYPRKGWVRKRRAMVKEGLVRMTRWNMGMRRTTFRPRTESTVGRGGERQRGGDIGDGVEEAEKVIPDPEGAVANLYYCQPLLIQLSQTFHVSDSRVSRVPTLLQAGYVVGLLFITPMGDLVRRRPLVIASVTISASLSIVLASTGSVVAFEALSFLTGVFTVASPILIPLAADLAPPERRASAMSIVLSGYLLGIVIARVLAGVIAEFSSWRIVYYVAVGVQYAACLGLYAFCPDYPAKNPSMGHIHVLVSMARLLVTEPLLEQACLVLIASDACYTDFWVTLTFILGDAPYRYSTCVPPPARAHLPSSVDLSYIQPGNRPARRPPAPMVRRIRRDALSARRVDDPDRRGRAQRRRDRGRVSGPRSVRADAAGVADVGGV
ncbi:hypothetical protein EWM64_g1096 [Hericium alpestre]|uniref:Major facilitator superfamily (MFS) profile domain-containing protein n=1 Tax=Hericium alpestre TaxID=135208 RepID=A0A4Z0A781_9AGAM|nr:hypothetical protein EWM64_g1096 [Hericium alpestre]